MLQSNLHCAAIEVTENTNRPLNQGYDGETRQELEEHLLTSIDTDPSDLPRWAKEEGITEPRASGAVSTRPFSCSSACYHRDKERISAF